MSKLPKIPKMSQISKLTRSTRSASLPKLTKSTSLPRPTRLARLKDSPYAQKMLARVRELQGRDAFEAAPTFVSDHSVVGTKVSAKQALIITLTQRRHTRAAFIAFGLVVAVVAALSLCLPYTDIDGLNGGGRVYAPGDVLAAYQLWFELNIMPLFDTTLSNLAQLKLNQFAAAHDAWLYNSVINRAEVTLVVAACGIMLALSGLLFQTAFRNPLASPSMLGVSEGVTLGCVIFFFAGNAGVGADPLLYLLSVYGFGALAVVVVLFLSRGITGGKRYNVFDMLLLGTVITQLIGGINQFVQSFIMTQAEFAQFFILINGGRAVGIPLVRIVVALVFLATIVPALVLRFRLNLISFSNDEARMMGARSGLLRGFALFLGSVMQLAAIATIGQIAMLSLVVPILVRFLLPSDFRSQFLGNCLIGTAVLLICVLLQHFVVIGLMAVPVGTIVSVFIVPFFVWTIAFGKGRWA